MSAKLKNITFTMEYTEELDKSFRFLSQENSVLTTAKLQDSEGHIVTFESLQILDNLLAQDLVDNCKPGRRLPLKVHKSKLEISDIISRWRRSNEKVKIQREQNRHSA